MRTGKVVAAIIGAVVALVAIGLIIGGGALLWAYGTQRDADGFLTSPDYELTTSAFAITSTKIDLGAGPGEWWPDDLATVRLGVEAVDADPVFVGIGPAEEVDAYLAGVGRHEITSVGDEPTNVSYRFLDGAAPATPPGEQTFWAASAEGPDLQTLTWEVDQGEWVITVMNADATADVAVFAEAGAKIGILPAVAAGLLVAGLLVGVLAALLLVVATRSEPVEGEPVHPFAGPALAGAYPLRLEGEIDPRLTRWQWLVKWLLAIPHLIVLAFLWVAFVFLTIVAFFAILFTGRYPRGIFDFNVGVMRWTWRVEFYAYNALATDQYPPFTLADVPDYPARLSVDYPEQLSRGLVLVKWWLLAIPHYLIVGLFTSGLIWWTTDIGTGDQVAEVGGGLIGLLVFIAAIALLFTSRYPRGLFDLIMGLNRWAWRVAAYASLMRDEYPPFRLDMGGLEPPAGGPEERPAGDGGDATQAPELTRT